MQSAAEIFSVKYISGPSSGVFIGTTIIPSARAFSASAAVIAFIRMAACGHSIAHLPHWIHLSKSHVATISDIARFSYLAVPTGYWPAPNSPSTRNLDTGIASPRCAAISPRVPAISAGASDVIAGTKSGAKLETDDGNLYSCKNSEALSTAAQLASTISMPFFLYVFSIATLADCAATAGSITCVKLKKFNMINVLILFPNPNSRAARLASRKYTFARILIRCSCASFGRFANATSGAMDVFIITVPPARSPLKISKRWAIIKFETLMKSATSIKYWLFIGASEKRTCDAVKPPDFFESYTA